MKTQIILSIISLIGFGSQSQTFDLADPILTHVSGAYYKDIDHILDNFTGSWLYTQNGTSLRIVLRKMEMQEFPADDGAYYQDVLVGRYEYISNNVPIANTLSLLYENVPYWEYSINGNYIISKNSRPVCDDCAENEKRIKLSYGEDDRKYLAGAMLLRRMDVGNIQKIKVRVFQRYGIILEPGFVPEFHDMKIPYGEYVLTKEN